MSTDQPNILLLSVDTLRADRLGVYGYDRPTTPNLDRFAKNAIVCDNAYTLGPFTQVACIQLFTSSRPFSYGGYDRGAAGRPDTIFKHFRNLGYHTWGLSTIHWVSPYYGYTDGLDEENCVFHLNTLVGMAAMTMRDTLRLYHEGRVDVDEMLATAAPVIRRLFDNVDEYCAMSLMRGDDFRQHFPDSKIVNDKYVFTKVKAVAGRHRQEFENDPLGYVLRHLGNVPQAHEWLSGDWRYCRTVEKLISEAALRISNRFLRVVSPRLAGARAAKYRFAVDAHAIAARVVKQLGEQPRDKPSFIWAHFKDTHQPFVSGAGRHWYRQTPAYLKALGHPDGIDPSQVFRGRPKTDSQWAETSALYDAAVRSTDEAIGKIFAAVDDLGLASNTVIGFASDHGEEIGEHGDYGHQVMMYEHNARIPMMFRAPGGTGTRVDALVTSLDWATTITELAGIEAAPGWAGRPVTGDEARTRNHILMESFCRGNCIFDHRPLYFGVRTKRYKYLWKEYVDPMHEFGQEGHELYDLDTDPMECDNLYRPSHPEVPAFDALIAARMAEILEIDEQRIIGLFGDAGHDAVGRVRRQPFVARN